MSEQRVVSKSEAGQRLDQLLATWLPGTSRSRVQQWLRSGMVQVDGVPGKRASERMKADQSVTWEQPARPEPRDTEGARVVKLDVLYTDDELIVVNKTAGLLSHRNQLDQADSVVELASERFGPLPEPERPDPSAPGRAGLVHRLDRGTSGVMLLARTPEALKHLQRQFSERTVTKRYRALVHRSPRFDSETVDAPIEVDPRHPDRRRVARLDDEGELGNARPALTRVDVVARYREAASLTCLPKTGRTHQIRVHLLHLGLPLIGDRSYRWPGALPDPLEEDAPVPMRPALHAASIACIHPGNGAEVSFSAPMPPDLLRLEAWLAERRSL